MFYLAKVLPQVQRVRLPLTRDQIMLLMAAVNEIMLGVDIYLAHSISGTIVPNEWIPIIFGPAAGVLLLIAGAVALRQRPVAVVIANLVFIASIVVGAMGVYFHIVRAILPYADPGQRVTLPLLVWAPPILGPSMFAMVGLLGISAAWEEDPADSGTLKLLFGRRLHLPYSKTRAYLFIVGLGSLVTLLSSVLDHARTGFENPWLWAPVAAGVMGAVAPVVVAAIDRPTRADVFGYVLAMGLMIAVGVTGAVLHVNDNLTSGSQFVAERFVRGAPILGPLLFANLGGLGLVAILDPEGSATQD